MMREIEEFTHDPKAVVISGAYDEWTAALDRKASDQKAGRASKIRRRPLLPNRSQSPSPSPSQRSPRPRPSFERKPPNVEGRSVNGERTLKRQEKLNREC